MGKMKLYEIESPDFAEEGIIWIRTDKEIVALHEHVTITVKDDKYLDHAAVDLEIKDKEV